MESEDLFGCPNQTFKLLQKCMFSHWCKETSLAGLSEQMFLQAMWFNRKLCWFGGLKTILSVQGEGADFHIFFGSSPTPHHHHHIDHWKWIVGCIRFLQIYLFLLEVISSRYSCNPQSFVSLLPLVFLFLVFLATILPYPISKLI